MLYQYLNTFDSSGKNLQLEWNSELERYQGRLVLEEISIGLYQSRSIWLWYNVDVNGDTKLTKPFVINSNENRQWKVEWDEATSDDRWFIYTLTSSNPPELNQEETLDLELDLQQNATNPQNDIPTLPESDINEEPLEINIGCKSEEEGAVERTLLIREADTNKIIFELICYTEFEEEDERLGQVIKQLGLDFRLSDFKYLKSSDITEGRIDWTILNRKRKELLLEHQNILPYRGTYKGLINAIKFFGYQQLKIKEYWLNLNTDSEDYGNKKLELQADAEKPEYRIKNFNEDDTWRKTGFFALVYDLNDITDEYDSSGLPITVESSEFSNAELFLKLFGLQEVLEKRFMPGPTRILEIRGEGDWFHKQNQYFWLTSQRIDSIHTGLEPKFSVSPKVGYIRDLRDIEYLLTLDGQITLPDEDIDMTSTQQLDPIYDLLLAYFEEYSPYNENKDSIPDNEGIPVGCPVKLTNESFDPQINEVHTKLKDLKDYNNRTWKFELKNFSVGDNYIIKDRYSGEQIETGTIGAGETIETIINSLTTKAQNETKEPWIWFSWSAIDDDNSGNNETIQAKQFTAGSVPAQFKAIVDEGSISPIFNLQKWERKFVSQGTIGTIKNFNRGLIEYIKWTVTKDDSDGISFEKELTGTLADAVEKSLNLPYLGNYHVTLEMRDIFNNISRLHKDNAIEVLPFEIEMHGWKRHHDGHIQLNQLKNNKLSSTYFSISDPIQNLAPLKDLHVSLFALNKNNTYQYDFFEQPENYRIDRFGIDSNEERYNINYISQIKNLKNVYLNESGKKHNVWYYDLIGYATESFEITNINQDASIIIEDTISGKVGVHTFQNTDLASVATEMNNLNQDVFNKYIWNPVYNENDQVVKLQIVHKYNLPNDTKNKITIKPDSNYVNLKNHRKALNRNPGFLDWQPINGFNQLPVGTHIMLDYLKSQIPGKTNPVWTLNNMSTGHQFTVESNLFSWLFDNTGNYKLSLELEDTNKNKYKKEVNLFKVI